MKNYKELQVWQRAFSLSVAVYKLTKMYPKEELFGLVSQMRRCSVSVFSNIAEGHGRGSTKDFKRFLNMALGSCNELEGQLLISAEIGYIKVDEAKPLEQECTEICKMLNGLSQKLS